MKRDKFNARPLPVAQPSKTLLAPPARSVSAKPPMNGERERRRRMRHAGKLPKTLVLGG